MHIPRAICGKCGFAMVILQNSVIFEMKTRVGEPYYKISCDIHECKGCNGTVALPASAPIAEAYQKEKYAAVPATRTGYFLT